MSKLKKKCDYTFQMEKKSGRFFCLNEVERKPVLTRVLNPKTCGVGWWGDGEVWRRDAGRAMPPAKKKLENFRSNSQNSFFKFT